MHLILIGNYPHDQQESMQRFAETLHRGFNERGYHAELIRPMPCFGRLKPSNTGLGKWLGYVDKFILFPFKLRAHVKEARQHGATVFHICDHSNAMYERWLRGMPCLATCNDLLAVRSALGEFSENRTKFTGRLLQKWILTSLSKVPRLACISHATLEDTVRLAGRTRANTDVVYMGMNYSYKPLEVVERDQHLKAIAARTEFDHAKSYLFHVGGSQWYKNRIGLIRIYKEMVKQDPTVPKLVIAGKGHTQAVKEAISRFDLEPLVQHVGRVTNEELNALYSGSTAFLFPSLAEGFGWPIIEAQASGCPVVTTNRPPMNEIGGEATIYVDPEKPAESAASIIGRLTESTDDREKRINDGLKNAAHFSTDRMLQEYIQTYKRLLSAV